MTDPYRDQDQTHRGEPWNQPPTPGAPGTTSGGVEGQGIPGPGVQGTAVPPPPVPHGDDKSGTGQQAKDSARNVAEDTKQAGGAVAGTAKDEALSVKDDAVREGRKLWDETSSTLSTQASDQLNRAAGTVRTFTDDLARMSRGEKPEDGLATDLAQQVTDRTAALAEWLENREPADVLAEVKSFARRRPVAFLAIAAGLGFAAGRLTRSVAQVHSDDDDQDVWASRTDTAGSYGPGDGQYRATPVDPSVGQAVPGTPGYNAPGQQGYPYDAPVPPAEPTRPVPPRLPETDGRGDIR
ncbi:hypothetical protein M3F57_10940 [Brachybacterium muris]|uniref:hypothetical protein n=1 Tax=Brachybacterium muris TaxID=219301 RepID=UPI00223B7D2E|nr:hypothetical protein [Brachybacterium muris]MCT1430282.1 hypothetical protein [Brachybacterium muris]MCT2296644.1 hypothetical protein [Brachybacterium muris]